MTSPSTPAIRVTGLAKKYGAHHAVRDVSFEVAAGETVALLGPNGAGKTTTVEILEGYRHRSAGAVEVLGVDPARAPREHKAAIGIVLQNTGAFDTATVREIVTLFAASYPAPRDVTATIEAVGLGGQADSRISTLSGGQRRRVDVALGIIGHPRVLFLDEPTTGFDPEARREFWSLIRGLQDEGTAILLTTHYLEEAAALAQRAVVIAAGRVVADSAIATLGGAGARTPRVSWQDGETRHQVITDHPAAVVAERYREGCAMNDLEVVRPTLEDIYLELIDAATPPARQDTDQERQR